MQERIITQSPFDSAALISSIEESAFSWSTNASPARPSMAFADEFMRWRRQWRL